MSDEILSVQTGFADVASLAQGYMNRADGERLLLPLPSACRQGAGVRFVVYLADGTPAFAGAGLCAQVSDQGDTVPAEQRFETLLDTLQFDERSRPVYDYIVAVRNAAYASQSDGGEVEAEVYEPAAAQHDSLAPHAELMPASDAPPEGDDAEPTRVASWPQPEQTSAWSQPAPADALGLPSAAPAPWSPPLNEMPSFIPPPLPTGLLTRPARTTHWQPSPPRRPTPRPATGLFRYPPGPLPRPARPPYPELDRSAWVHPAPRPAS